MIIIVVLMMSSAGISSADDDALWTTTITPDALIVLDLSGSMAWLPHGSQPTLYACGGSCNEPYYETPQLSGVPSKLYVSGDSCYIDGPFTVNPPAATPDMPTSDLWVEGSTCYIDGPFYLTKPSDALNLGTYVYINTNQSCGFDGPFYPSSGTGHTKPCKVAGEAAQGEWQNVCVRYGCWWRWGNCCEWDSQWVVTSEGYPALPTPVYKSDTGTCTTGLFYRTSGTGHTTTCTKYKQCDAPETGYTETDCTTGPFYKTSGAGHTTYCGSGGSTSKQCDSPSPAYTETTCTAGPFYKTSGSGHTTICQNCTTSCTPSGTTYRWSDTASCDGPFYSSSNSGARSDCSKLAIAKRSLYQLMDANDSDDITATDITSLGIRLGLMRYYNCGSEDNDTSHTDPWNYGCTKLSWSMTQSDNTTTTPYGSLFCNNASCASTVSACTVTSPAKECIAGYDKSGGTPIGDSLEEAKKFLTYHKTIDAASTCRQKSIILITDGEDTYACNGNGSDTNISQRRAPIYWAKQAADNNFKVYVVGFGADMPTNLQDTLNWAAYYGKTRNPNATQSGDSSAVTVGTNPCSNGTDPAGKTLRGYAFMASNPEELVSSLATALSSILEATYSFSTQASVAAARVQEENFIYEASFEPKNNSGTLKEPFWTGHLKKYQIGDSGSVITPHCWDAGELLKIADPANRNMYTLKNGAMTLFNTSYITAADLAVADDAARNLVVGFYRGEPAYNLENWKLGDLFHTNPAIIKTPLQFFYDPRECTTSSHNSFVSNNIRTAANGKQIILVGANDGQLHAIRTGTGTDCTSGGDEVWSFIPPNFLQKISPIAHNSHADRASLASHDFFVDGPIQVFDAWLGSGSGITKSASDWKTLAVFGEGAGSGAYLWSSSSNCYSTSTAAFSATYSDTNRYYCGLHALDVTNASNGPVYKWHLNPTTAQAPYLGEAWSKFQTGRVKIGNNEKFVGFVGGGYNASACLAPNGTSYLCTAGAADGSAPYRAGKGFFVVDLTDGSIIWSYTHASNASMDFSAAASPYPVDTDSDGFIDTVYMGDLGGNMWRFRLCPKDPNCATCGLASYNTSQCTSCTTSDWTGSLLYVSNNAERGSGLPTPTNTHKQIFTMATAAYDTNNNLWIFFGTGENSDPTYRPTDAELAADPSGLTKNRLYAVKEDLKDPAFTDTYTLSDLQNITSTTYADADNKHGWYVNLATNPLTRSDGTTISNPKGEKMISDPTIFGGLVYFATYVPHQGGDAACGQAGDAFLYKLNYMTGDRSVGSMGHGIGSSILVSYRPGFTNADIYATTSGGAGTGALTQTMGEAPKESNMTNILYWKDRRLH